MHCAKENSCSGRRTVVLAILLWGTCTASGALSLGPAELVEANGEIIQVPGYSAPSYVDWNNDGRGDLVVGEGGFFRKPGIQVWLNDGTESEPHFTESFYVRKTDGEAVGYIGTDCTCRPLGLSPRVVHWDADGRKDLLVGQLDGRVRVYLNTGTDVDPVFDEGIFLQVGPLDSRSNIDIGDVAIPAVVDWDNDGKKDLLLGANDSTIHVFINEGTDTDPFFLADALVQENDSDLMIRPAGAAPDVADWDGDGMKDLLIGTSEGQVWFYRNVGTDSNPSFSGHSLIEAAGAPIQVDAITGASPRARPFVSDWSMDGYPDLLVGAGDGQVYLYQAVPEVTSLALLTMGWGAIWARRTAKRSRPRHPV